MCLSELIRKELVGVQDGKKYGLLEHAELEACCCRRIYQ